MKAGDLGDALRRRLREAGALRRARPLPKDPRDRSPAQVLEALRRDLKKKGGGGGNKHNARKVVVDGHVFQSQLEADYYAYLKLIKVPEMRPHPSVVLTGGIRYKPDFVFAEGGRLVFVDTKGDSTTGGRFPTIKKLWKVKAPGILRVVYRGPRGTFLVKQEIHPQEVSK